MSERTLIINVTRGLLYFLLVGRATGWRWDEKNSIMLAHVVILANLSKYYFEIIVFKEEKRSQICFLLQLGERY
jgi:hypothetical protein